MRQSGKKQRLVGEHIQLSPQKEHLHRFGKDGATLAKAALTDQQSDLLNEFANQELS